ncbi:Hypothetical protein HVR_LOCUS727 [uncultured virus]|nr:Hypothetical protein HVR_LOCUS727 [uncultured virus]
MNKVIEVNNQLFLINNISLIRITPGLGGSVDVNITTADGGSYNYNMSLEAYRLIESNISRSETRFVTIGSTVVNIKNIVSVQKISPDSLIINCLGRIEFKLDEQSSLYEPIKAILSR